MATVFPLRFPGQYYDAETGTHYNYHRDYDPAMGRYTQADPLGVAGGLNVYAYAGNDPARMVDPLGLVECGWWNQNCSFGDPAGAAPRCATAECAAGLGYREPSCRAVCFAEFANPIPDAAFEFGVGRLAKASGSEVAGLIAKDTARKLVKVIGAYDLAACLDQCKSESACNTK